LVPKAGIGAPEIGIVAKMKPEQEDRLDARGVHSQPSECSPEWPRPPEIVGEIENPLLETVRRLWWRAFDRMCGCFWSLRLSLFDRIHGPEPATPADVQREADHERLVRAFPMAGEQIKPGKCHTRQNRGDDLGSHYR
jgi:hypothetical protein